MGGLLAHNERFRLSEREKEIVCMMAKGKTRTAIANALFLSFYTVDSHVKRIYLKLGVHTKEALIAKAIEENLIDKNTEVTRD